MTVTKSPRVGLTRWSVGTDPFERAQMSESFEALEANVALFVQGSVGSRPAPGKVGRFHVTPAGLLSYDNGTAWVDVSPDLAPYATKTALAEGLATKAATVHNHTRSQITDFAHTHTRADVTDFAHTHPLADLPVAGSGVSSSTQLVRADDSRLADARIPTGLATGHLAGSYPSPQVLMVGYTDTRNAATTPGDYIGVARWQLKSHSAIGLSESSTAPSSLAFVYGFRAVGDTSVAAWEYAYSDSGNVWRRRGTSSSWNAWLQVESGTAATVFSNDPRLSDARPPTSHRHDDLYFTEDEVTAQRKADRPVGEVTYYYGTKTGMGPDWLCMDGSTFSASAYPVLYTKLGNSTTLPDARDRFILGASAQSGDPSNVRVMGSTGGSHTKTLTIDQMPRHNHGVSENGHAHRTYDFPSGFEASGYGLVPSTAFENRVMIYRPTGDVLTTASSGVGVSVLDAGGGQSHNVTPPYLALWPMMRAR